MVSSPSCGAPQWWWWCVVLACMPVVPGAWYDTYTGNQIGDERLNDLRRNDLLPWCAIEVADCSADEPRRPDHTCNNIHYPSRGAFMTPFHRLLRSNYATNGGPRSAKSGRELPNARALRVALIPDGRLASKKFTNHLTNMNLFVINDVTSVHDTVNYVAVTTTCCAPGGDKDPRCIPIPVASDDVHLRRSPVRCLNLTRAITYQRLGCVPTSLPGERINTAAPMLELSHVYGTNAARAISIRELKGGRLKAETLKGKEWPPGKSPLCINNSGAETRCHEAGEPGVNGLIGTNLPYMWAFRQHNAIASALARVNPCWDDEKLYAVAKDINIAMMQQIAYYDLMVNVIGYDYLVKNQAIFPGHGHVDDYDPTLEPRVSIEYVVGMRWFHTLQEGKLNLYDRHGKLYGQLSAVDLSLRTGLLPLNNTLEGLTQGSFRQPCASNDYAIDPDMGERSLGRLQFASDVLAADIMKSRDLGLPPYNRYRRLCKLPVAKDFDDLYRWMPKMQVEALTLSYEDVDDIDLQAGILAELPMEGSVMGPTLACVITAQLLRWRRADRFWFENRQHPGAFTPEQLQQIRKMTMSKVICDHGDSVDAVQYNAFQLPGYGNEFVPCSEYPEIDYEAWRDYSCIVQYGNTQLYGFDQENKQNKEDATNNTQLYALREDFQELFEKLALKDGRLNNPAWIQWNQNNPLYGNPSLSMWSNSPALNQLNQNKLNQLIQNNAQLNRNPTVNQLNQNNAVINNNGNINQLNQNNAILNNDPSLNQNNQNNAFDNSSPNLNQLNQNNAIGNSSPNLNQLNQNNAIGNSSPNLNQLNQNIAIGNSSPDLNQLNQNNAIGNSSPDLNQLNQNNAIGNSSPNLNQLNQNNAIGNSSPNLNQFNQNNAIGNRSPNLNQLNQNSAISNSSPNLNQLNHNSAIGNSSPNLNQLNQNNAIGNSSPNLNQLNQNSAVGNSSPNLNQLNQNNAIGNSSPNLNQLNQNSAIGNRMSNLNQLNQNSAIGNSMSNLNQLNQNNAIGNSSPNLNQLNQNSAIGNSMSNLNQLNQNSAIGNSMSNLNQLNQNNAIGNSSPNLNQLNQNSAIGNSMSNLNQLNQNNAIGNSSPNLNQLNQNSAIGNTSPNLNQLNQNNAIGNSSPNLNQLNQNSAIGNISPNINQLNEYTAKLNNNPTSNQLNQNNAQQNSYSAFIPNNDELYSISYMNQLNQNSAFLNSYSDINQLNQNNAILNNNPTLNELNQNNAILNNIAALKQLNQNNAQQENNQAPNQNSDNPSLVQINQNNAILNRDSNINQINQNDAQVSNNQPIVQLNQNNAALNDNTTVNQLNQNNALANTNSASNQNTQPNSNPTLIQVNQNNALLNNNANIDQLNQNNVILNNDPVLNQENQNNAIANNDLNLNQLNQNNAKLYDISYVSQLNQNNALLNNIPDINQLKQNNANINNYPALN